MIRPTTTRPLFRSLAAAALLAVTGSLTASAQSLLYGIGGADTGNGPTNTAYSLFNFNSSAPGTTTTIGTVTATAGYVVTSIAFQPSTGNLYGFQYNSTTSQGQLVQINRFSAAVTPLGTPTGIGSITGSAGPSATISFNPSNGNVRLVTGTQGNYVININTFAFAQGTSVAYAAGDPNVNNTYQISTVAYTSAAALYDLDYINGSLATQNLTTGALTTVGALGFAPSQGAQSQGFTIGLGNAAFANFNVAGNLRDNLYSINLASGAATSLGAIGAAGFNTVDIAAFVPEPGTYALLGLGGAVLLLAVRRQRRAA